MKQGLSHARNFGLHQAKGEFIGYIDDDCLIPNDFLNVAKKIIEQLSPGIFSGPSYSFYQSPKPRWYKDRYGSNVPFKEQRQLRHHDCEYIHGCNMFFRRSLLLKIGGFDPTLGMSGDKIFYGEETAAIRKVIDVFPETSVYYAPRLYLYHLVQDERMQLKWFFRMFFARGGTSYHIRRCKLERGRKINHSHYQLLDQLMRTVIVLGIDLVRCLCMRNRNQHPHWQNYVIEHSSRHIIRIGILYEQYKFRSK
jgi:glycosyltransferase involved in cell wall biosynthesis